MGVNNGVKMDQGPVIFTSDVSLPKDDKNASEVKKIKAGQLTGLWRHRNANYAAKKGRAQKQWAVRQGK